MKTAVSKTTSIFDLKRRDLAAQAELAARTASGIFRMYGWTWGPVGGVPDENDIINTLDDLFCQLLEDSQSRSISTGRLKVARDDSSPTGFTVSLEL